MRRSLLLTIALALATAVYFGLPKTRPQGHGHHDHHEQTSASSGIQPNLIEDSAKAPPGVSLRSRSDLAISEPNNHRPHQTLAPLDSRSGGAGQLSTLTKQPPDYSADETSNDSSPWHGLNNLKETNTGRHCAFSEPAPNSTLLYSLTPGTIFEVERKLAVYPYLYAFFAQKGKVDGEWSTSSAGAANFFSMPATNPRYLGRLDKTEEDVDCRVTMQGISADWRTIDPKVRLVLKGVSSAVEIAGEPLSEDRGVVLSFDSNKLIQTIVCRPAGNGDANLLTIADFKRSLGDRFDVCAPQPEISAGRVFE